MNGIDLRFPKQAHSHRDLAYDKSDGSNRTGRMAYLINTLGLQVKKGLNKITYRTINQMEYKFTALEEHLKEYVCNFCTEVPSLVRSESHKEKHQWI